MSNEFKKEDYSSQPKRKKGLRTYNYEEEKGMTINVGNVGRVKKRNKDAPKVNIFSGFDHGFGQFGIQ